MKPEGKIIGISPEIIEMSASDLPEVEYPSEPVLMLPDAVLKEAVTSVPAEKVIKAFYNVGMAAREAAISLQCAAKATAEAIINNYYITTSPNSRVKHLALHAKKRRVRKKNIARIMRENYYRYYFLEIDEIHELKIDPAIMLSAPAIKFKERGSIYDSNNN